MFKVRIRFRQLCCTLCSLLLFTGLTGFALEPYGSTHAATSSVLQICGFIIEADPTATEVGDLISIFFELLLDELCVPYSTPTLPYIGYT